MGDTFDKVKDNEDDLLLMNRAKFIDASEAGLSPMKQKEIEYFFLNRPTLYS